MVVYLKKVSLYVDEKVWSRFREAVFRRHGTLRQLSAEAEALMGSFAVDDVVASAFARMKVDVHGTISSRDIKLGRPVLKGPPSEEIVEKMRRARVGETLP